MVRKDTCFWGFFLCLFVCFLFSFFYKIPFQSLYNVYQYFTLITRWSLVSLNTAKTVTRVYVTPSIPTVTRTPSVIMFTIKAFTATTLNWICQQFVNSVYILKITTLFPHFNSFYIYYFSFLNRIRLLSF